VRVLFICGREPTYIRNRMILKALKSHFEVVEITSHLRNVILRNLSLIVKFLVNRAPYDLVFVGFYGHPLMLWVRPLTRKPIVFDAYVSTYDTLCFDRKWFAPHSFRGRFAFWLDKYACQLADKVILDTKTHISYFKETFGLADDKFSLLYVGADEEIFHPRPMAPRDRFILYSQTSFLPHQGMEYVLEAAKQLREDKDIEFLIVGDGPLAPRLRRLSRELGLANVRFSGWVPLSDLPRLVAQASVCLAGHFSDGSKARSVVPSKAYQFIAMGKPTIVADLPSNREIFSHGTNAYFCQPASGQSIAEAILELKRDAELRHGIAEAGYDTFRSRFTVEALGRELAEILG